MVAQPFSRAANRLIALCGVPPARKQVQHTKPGCARSHTGRPGSMLQSHRVSVWLGSGARHNLCMHAAAAAVAAGTAKYLWRVRDDRREVAAIKKKCKFVMNDSGIKSRFCNCINWSVTASKWLLPHRTLVGHQSGSLKSFYWKQI